MKDTKRAVRRHHRNRMLARAMRSFVVLGTTEEHRLPIALRRFNNMQSCACWMCGNRRKIWGPNTRDLRLEMIARFHEKNWQLDEQLHSANMRRF